MDTKKKPIIYIQCLIHARKHEKSTCQSVLVSWITGHVLGRLGLPSKCTNNNDALLISNSVSPQIYRLLHCFYYA